MTINCIAIDDEQPAIEQIEEYISRIPFLNLVKSFDNAIEPMSFLKENKIDVVFLDIEMENFTGLQFIKTLSHKPQIILTTAYDKYAIEAFNLSVTDYLLKPISFERFLQSVDKIFDIFSNTVTHDSSVKQYKRDYVFIKTEYRYQRVDFEDILFIEGMREYLKIHTTKEKIMTLMSFKDIEEMLPVEGFFRVHKSYIVAIKKVDNFERNRISIGDNKIPVSETYKDTFLKFITK